MEENTKKKAEITGIGILAFEQEKPKKNQRKTYASEIRATNRYNSRNYDRMQFFVPKGQKEIIRRYVRERGESVNGLVNRLISEELSKNGVDFTPVSNNSQESGP